MEEYRIILSPDLDITPEELVAIWNVTPECQEVGHIEISSGSTAKLFEPSTFTMVLKVFGVAIPIIIDLMIRAIKKQKPTIVTENEEIEITQTKDKLKIKKTKITKQE
jgi:hypothetical protein